MVSVFLPVASTSAHLDPYVLGLDEQTRMCLLYMCIISFWHCIMKESGRQVWFIDDVHDIDENTLNILILAIEHLSDSLTFVCTNDTGIQSKYASSLLHALLRRNAHRVQHSTKLPFRALHAYICHLFDVGNIATPVRRCVFYAFS
jgi:hypothetical protein